MEAELEYASRDAKYYELSAQLANLERERAEVLRKKLEEADRAKTHEDALTKKMEFYKSHGITESDEYKLLQTMFDENHTRVLSKEDRRKMEQAIAVAMANAKKVDELNEKARVAYSTVIEKKDELNVLNRLPPPRGATED